MTELLQSPLDAQHRELGAKWAEFGGWAMPLEYAGGGTAKEHAAVRATCGIFDVSHLGTALISGNNVADFVNRVFTNDLNRIGHGQAQYTLLCDDDGDVIDDLIVYRRDDANVLIVPNASNSARVLTVLRDMAPEGIDVVDQHQQTAIIAVQGPRSAEVLDAVGLRHDMKYMAFEYSRFGEDVIVKVCRTGYTGEHGYELLVLAEHAAAVWDALLSEVVARDGLPCGLSARDTLRTEMGYPLHGQDLGHGITPVQARLGWAVGWGKPEFPGRDALTTEREAGPTRRILGLQAVERAIPRAGMTVLTHTDGLVGEVTSGTFSPTLSKGIALALLDASVPVGHEVLVDVRGRQLPFTVVTPPFVDASPQG